MSLKRCCDSGEARRSLSKSFTPYEIHKRFKLDDSLSQCESPSQTNPYYVVDVTGDSIDLVSIPAPAKDVQGDPNILQPVNVTTDPVAVPIPTRNAKDEPGILDLADASHTIQDPPTWTLSVKDVPASAKKIYCVLRGRKPGFYFDWFDGAEKQVRGFPDGLYMAFPRGSKKAMLNPFNMQSALQDAIRYMNHDPTSCSYGCGGKCHGLANDTAVKEESEHQGSLELAAPETEEKLDPSMCRFCRVRPKTTDKRLCDDCLSGSDLAQAIKQCAQRFGLVDEQARVLDLIVRGHNVFYTGAAGTGKSKILEAAAAFFNVKDRRVKMSIVAPTGIAAVAVGGSTIHTFAGWTARLAQSSLGDLRNAAWQTKILQRFDDTHILFIEEISMVESDTLTRLSAMMISALSVQGFPEPFGGVQVVMCGDFYQLPPVKPFQTCTQCGDPLVRRDDIFSCKSCERSCHDREKWAFKSPVWSDLQLINIELKRIHRQLDPEFRDILNCTRVGGSWTDDQENALLSYNEDFNHNSATKLMPLRKDVAAINTEHMSRLRTARRMYHCVDHLELATIVTRQPRAVLGASTTSTPRNEDHIKLRHPEYADLIASEALKKHRYESELELKTDMQVLLTANIDVDAGLANGSSGIVIGFVPIRDESLSEIKNDKKDVENRGRAIADYQAKRIRAFAEQAKKRDRWWPLVQFRNGVKRVIHAHCSITELGKDPPYSLLSRTQIPLVAGWAITIHKSQGMTLDCVSMDLAKCFAAGHAYVALSRARSMDTMSVQTLPPPSKMRPDKTVQEFMEQTFGHTAPPIREERRDEHENKPDECKVKLEPDEGPENKATSVIKSEV